MLKRWIAFQLQDDYLDVYGDPAVFGKKIGGDILCGKKDVLLINALERADEATRNRLLALIEDHNLPGRRKNCFGDRHLQPTEHSFGDARGYQRFYAEAHSEIAKLSLPESQWLPLWNMLRRCWDAKNKVISVSDFTLRNAKGNPVFDQKNWS